MTEYEKFIEWQAEILDRHCKRYGVTAVSIEQIDLVEMFPTCYDASQCYAHKVHFSEGEPMLIVYKKAMIKRKVQNDALRKVHQMARPNDTSDM